MIAIFPVKCLEVELEAIVQESIAAAQFERQ